MRAGDIDIIYLNGYGFPAYRGGPMWYADTVGLKKSTSESVTQRAHGELWEPAPLLKQLAVKAKHSPISTTRSSGDLGMILTNDQRRSTTVYVSENMREAVVVASSRTGLAKSFRGSFNMTRPEELAAHCIRDVLRKTPQLDPKEIEDVVLGCGQPHGVQGHNIARVSALLAGLPVSVAAITVKRFCSSGLQAIAMMAHQIVNEGAEAAIGGGVESVSLIVRDNDPSPVLKQKCPGVYMVMGETAEVVAKRYKIGRQARTSIR